MYVEETAFSVEGANMSGGLDEAGCACDLGSPVWWPSRNAAQVSCGKEEERYVRLG